MRINNGHISERGLARLLGVSQPQIHNVLKGKRRLQPELADRLLEKFKIDLRELLQTEEYLTPPQGRGSTDFLKRKVREPSSEQHMSSRHLSAEGRSARQA